MNAHNLPAQQISLHEVVQEYNAKKAGGQVTRANPDGTLQVVAEYGGLDAIIADYERVHTDVSMASTLGGTYVGRAFDYHPSLSKRRLEETLLESAWRHVYKGLQIDKIASAGDRSRFDMELKNPPEFTLDNIRATFGKYLLNPRENILRGLAEVFCDLDQAYKSHSKVKIGVEGLPKRIILNGFGEYSYGSYGQAKFRDVMNALASYTGQKHIHDGHVADMVREARKNGECMWWGGRLKVFANGNGHLFFDKHALTEINKALAEYYGDVLPDTPDVDAKKKPGTEVSKDLQYYPTPQKVIDRILDRHVALNEKGKGLRFLEPDCGDARIMSTVKGLYPEIAAVGVEVHGGRADQARSFGHKVLTANFLQVKPNPVYDLIVMNPPFYGLHWQKHLLHAIKFLNPAENGRGRRDSTLICILPAAAFYDGHLGKMGLIAKDAHKKDRGWRDTGWRDLPVASFAESGTNVPTGYFITTGEKK